jgi:hypothetical protein
MWCAKPWRTSDWNINLQSFWGHPRTFHKCFPLISLVSTKCVTIQFEFCKNNSSSCGVIRGGSESLHISSRRSHIMKLPWRYLHPVTKLTSRETGVRYEAMFSHMICVSCWPLLGKETISKRISPHWLTILNPLLPPFQGPWMSHVFAAITFRPSSSCGNLQGPLYPKSEYKRHAKKRAGTSTWGSHNF